MSRNRKRNIVTAMAAGVLPPLACALLTGASTTTITAMDGLPGAVNPLVADIMDAAFKLRDAATMESEADMVEVEGSTVPIDGVESPTVMISHLTSTFFQSPTTWIRL